MKNLTVDVTNTEFEILLNTLGTQQHISLLYKTQLYILPLYSRLSALVHLAESFLYLTQSSS